MKNKNFVNLSLYMLLILVVIGTMYFSYALFHPNNILIEKNDINGDEEVINIIFEANGATSVEKNSMTCNKNDGKCEIIMPDIKRENGIVLGWSRKNSNNAEYEIGEILEIENNQIFYAITYTLNTLTIDNNNLDYLEKNNISCRVYNKDKTCTVVIPNYNKIGYENRGYSLRKDSLTGTIFPTQTYSLKKDVTIYPIYNILTRGEKIDVEQTLNKYNFVIEIEKGCESGVYNGYLSYIDNIYEKAKYLLIGSKITFVNNETFSRLWGNNYVGMNYGPNMLRLFDVRCPSDLSINYYPTMVHELAHTWDFYYRNYYEKNISDENDYINLYSKYKDMVNRPFRDYSYSNIREFFADSVRFYYFKYIDPIEEYYDLDYPLDIKNVLEKYICIANNGYNRLGC